MLKTFLRVWEGTNWSWKMVRDEWMCLIHLCWLPGSVLPDYEELIGYVAWKDLSFKAVAHSLLVSDEQEESFPYVSLGIGESLKLPDGLSRLLGLRLGITSRSFFCIGLTKIWVWKLLVDGHWVRRKMRCCPAGGFYHLWHAVGCSNTITPAGNEQEELNESRPQLPFGEIGCDFLNSAALYSSRHTAPVAEQGSLPKADIALSWICTKRDSQHGECQPESIPLVCRAFITSQLWWTTGI